MGMEPNHRNFRKLESESTDVLRKLYFDESPGVRSMIYFILDRRADEVEDQIRTLVAERTEMQKFRAAAKRLNPIYDPLDEQWVAEPADDLAGDFAYIDSSDSDEIDRFMDAVYELFQEFELGYSVQDVRRGSFLAIIKTWFKTPVGQQAASRSSGVFDGANVWVESSLQEKTAEVDGINADTLLKIAEAAGTNDFAVRFRGIIALRITKSDGSKTLVCRPLSPKETLALDRHPELFDNPSVLMQSLADIIQLDSIQSLEDEESS